MKDGSLYGADPSAPVDTSAPGISDQLFGAGASSPVAGPAPIPNATAANSPDPSAIPNAVPTPANATTLAAPGGQWAPLDARNQTYTDASTQVAQETGVTVPPEIIKAINANESGFDYSPPGGQNCEVRPEMGCLANNVGIFQSVADDWGLDYNRIVNDPAYGSYAIGVGLQKIGDYTTLPDGSPVDPSNPGANILDSYGWEGVVNTYFSGHPVPNGYTDEKGNVDGEYTAHIMSMAQETAGAPVSTPAGAATLSAPQAPPLTVPTAAGGSDTLFGAGASNPISSDPATQKAANQTTLPPPDQTGPPPPIGPMNALRYPVVSGTYDATPATDAGGGIQATPDSDDGYLNTMSPDGMVVSTEYKQPVTWDVSYDYQIGHGADGTVHAGIDMYCGDPNGDCYGSPVNTPIDGTVVCSGYGQGPGGDTFNCNYATSPAVIDNGGAGQITLDVGKDASGQQILLNMIHMADSVVQPGQQLQAGDQIGGMGSMGGAVHTHMEAIGTCNGTYVYLDPTLVVHGYYNDHSACEGL